MLHKRCVFVYIFISFQLKKTMKEIWNNRYSKDDYVYGKEPNDFFAEQLQKIKPGTILLPCEGEGRNAVFAASIGWNVIAFDQSESGKEKALALAKEKSVSVNYIISDAVDFELQNNSVDIVAFIYAHFPVAIRKLIHQKVIDWIKPNGIVIMEAFNQNQLKNNSGGPKDLSMLYTKEILSNDFNLLKTELLQYSEIELKEGNLHQGIADVIRYVGRKM